MKIKGSVTLLIGTDNTTLRIEDTEANIHFLEIILSPEQLTALLSRQANVKCDIKVDGIENVGKKHENKSFEFEIPESVFNSYSNRESAAKAIVDELLTDGWVADNYFGSQGSFFKKQDKCFARVTIRRWI